MDLFKKKNRKEIKRLQMIEYLSDHCYLVSPANNIVIWYKDEFFGSQCHKEETFNIKKGLLVCISKIAGYTYNKIKDKLKLRGCENSDSAELFFLYDIAFNSFGLTENDIELISKNVEPVG